MVHSKENNCLAIIPARGGSKRLPHKNLLKLNNIPLIGKTIQVAKSSRFIDRVVVSTESPEIAEVAKQFGVEVPFLRSGKLASDIATSVDVVSECLQMSQDFWKEKFDHLILLQPTSPLRTATHIDEAMELYFLKQAHAIVSVCPCNYPPQLSNTLPPNGSLVGFIKQEYKQIRSQDLETYYHPNGAIYIINIDVFLKKKSFYIEDNIYAYTMDRKSSVDIDTKEDFEWAQFISKNGSNNSNEKPN